MYPLVSDGRPSSFLSLDTLPCLESYSQASNYSHYIEVSFVGTGGGYSFHIGNKAMITVLWHRIAKLATISILDNLVLYSSLSIYDTIVVL